MDVPGPEPSDEALAARAAAGDESAFEALMVRYQARAYRLAWRLVGAEGDAQDAVQEAFLQVFRKLATFRGEARFSTWLYRIVTNAALMQRRQRARRRGEPLDACLPAFDAEGRHAASPAEIAAASDIEARMDQRRLAEKARAGIDRLPETYRAAFVLRDLEELETAEVGAVLGLEPGTVRQRVHRARLMLRGYLAGLAEGKG
jgi:RNA polymerase sigma-70 factor (ECF subfamily)